MSKLTEAAIENLAIELLQAQEYTYEKMIERSSFEEVLLVEKVKEAIARINPTIPQTAQTDALKQIQNIHTTDLAANNEKFHEMLTEGIKVTYQKNTETRGDLVWLIDFENVENNEFSFVNQYTVEENRNRKRLDIILFINGIPVVVMELKNPTSEKATLYSAYTQLQTYKQEIPSFFTYNGFLIISDGIEAKVGTISSDYSRFMAWKSKDGKVEASSQVGQLEILIQGMLNKNTLIDLLRHFIVFQDTREVTTNEITNIKIQKKLASYHQYYAVNKAVDSTLRAAGFVKSKENYEIHVHKSKTTGNKFNSKKGGVIWHTQGSGKSLSMVFYVGKIVLAMDNPTIVVITDRNDLDDQLFDTFAASRQLLRQEPKQAESREDLKKLLKVASGGIIFTTIQKFQPEEGNVYEKLSDRDNIIVIADEAHRTQYGFKAKTIDEKDEKGKVTGQKIVYGFAKYLRDALPNATYLGFTGTPIEKEDKNTPAVFGDYIDIYDISRAVQDGATVPIYYESRLAKITLSEEGKKLLQELDKELQDEDLETQKAKSKWTQLEALVGSKDRIQKIANDIVTHFEKRLEVIEGKGMIVTMSRRIAVELYDAIVQLRPNWHSEDLKKGVIKVVITSSSSDGDEFSKHRTTKEQRRILADRIKNPEDELKLVIVRDMWLTGFDVPCLHTMYIDKPMKGHGLMQAIARVNRVYKDKTGGLVVDYLGIASDLKQALSFYAEAGGKGDIALDQEKAVELMLEKFEVVSQMFHGSNYKQYFTADTNQKISILLAAQEHILSLEDGKKRFIKEVTALSQVYSIAIPHEKALGIREEVAFFQELKSRLLKFEPKITKNNVELETVLKQKINEALVSNKVVDIFDELGIKKPDVSVLSEDFLLEVKNMQYKNVAVQLLNKILTEQIHVREKKNLVQSKTLLEMLEKSIQKYHNKILTASEVIEELIFLAKDIQAIDKEPKEMGLTDYEYAFYTAIASNESAREVMQKEKLRELAVVLYREVKKNASIDWQIRESVRAQLRVIVKRTLRKYGYPPDMQELATETVLKQAELIAEELSKEI